MSIKVPVKRNQYVIFDSREGIVYEYPSIQDAGDFLSEEIECGGDIDDYTLIDLGSNGSILPFDVQEEQVSEPEYEYRFRLL